MLKIMLAQSTKAYPGAYHSWQRVLREETRSAWQQGRCSIDLVHFVCHIWRTLDVPLAKDSTDSHHLFRAIFFFPQSGPES